MQAGLHISTEITGGVDANIQLLEAVIGNSPDGIALVDARHIVKLVNESALTLLAVSKESILSRPFPHPLTGGQPYEFRIETQNAEPRFVAGRTQEMMWNHREHMILSLRDVTERVRLRERLRSDSMQDELTGLYNRRGFIYFAEHHILLSGRSQQGMMVIFIDLDGLKKINDGLGHKIGDLAIIQAANVMRKTFRKSDVLARIGGDEFAVLALGRGSSDAKLIHRRISVALASENSNTSAEFRLSFSMGFAYYDPANPCSLENLLERADQSMYQEKRQKKQ